MVLKPGARLQSTTDTTEVVVVRAPSTEIDLCCGGHPMVPLGEGAGTAEPVAGFDAGTLVGKRYADDVSGLELLCTKAGSASLSLGSEILTVRAAKPLPSSD